MATTDVHVDEPPPIDQFKPAQRGSFFCQDCALWLRFDLQSLNEKPMTAYIEVPAMVSSAQIFRQGDSWPSAFSGRSFGLYERTLPDVETILPITLTPSQSSTYILRLTGRYPMGTQLKLFSETGWAEAKARRWIYFSLYIGSIFSMLFLNLLLFFFADRRTERFYDLIFQFSFPILHFVHHLGYSIYLWPHSPNFDFYVRYITFAIGLSSFSLFTSSFLQLKSQAPRLNRIILVLGFAWIPLSILASSWAQLDIFIGPFSFLHFFFILWVSISLMIKGERPARWFIASNGSLVISLVVFMLINRGIWTPDFISLHPTWIPQIGAFLYSLISLLAISDKIVLERRKRLDAEEEKSHSLAEAKDLSEKVSNAKTEFIRNMSHELRTPLNSLVGYSDILVQHIESGEESYEETFQVALVLKKQSERLTGIISDILDYANLEEGNLRKNIAPFHLQELLEEVYGLFAATLDAKKLHLDLKISPEVPAIVTSDRFRLRQILMNIVGNACKFSEIGRITISVSRENQRLMIRIHDQGPGIPTDYHNLIFEPFYQIYGDLRRSHGGAGLGLSFSRSLARALGGDVKLLWTSLGEGSTFEIQLPLTSTLPSLQLLDIST
jgi:signal transduction histidine kinase